jgi:hypothetical protein
VHPNVEMRIGKNGDIGSRRDVKTPTKAWEPRLAVSGQLTSPEQQGSGVPSLETAKAKSGRPAALLATKRIFARSAGMQVAKSFSADARCAKAGADAVCDVNKKYPISIVDGKVDVPKRFWRRVPYERYKTSATRSLRSPTRRIRDHQATQAGGDLL